LLVACIRSGSERMAYGWKGEVWVIGSILYVGGMFLIFYFYQFKALTDPGLIAFISIGGAFVVLAQMFVGAFDEKGAPKSK
jgi:hypothetical protein